LLVSVDVAGLTAGVYKGMVTIAATKDGPVSIPVTLYVEAPAQNLRNQPALSSAGAAVLSVAGRESGSETP
jgi:hypothetical protein